MLLTVTKEKRKDRHIFEINRAYKGYLLQDEEILRKAGRFLNRFKESNEQLDINGERLRILFGVFWHCKKGSLSTSLKCAFRDSATLWLLYIFWICVQLCCFYVLSGNKWNEIKWNKMKLAKRTNPSGSQWNIVESWQCPFGSQLMK